MSAGRQQEYESKAQRDLSVYAEVNTKGETMYTLNWQPPYDWSWMFGFLAARAVTGLRPLRRITTSAVLAMPGTGAFSGLRQTAQPIRLRCRLAPPDPGGGYLPDRIARLLTSIATRSTLHRPSAISARRGRGYVCPEQWMLTSRACAPFLDNW